MVAPVRFKPSDENDLAIPAREITSRHRVDRRSLLLPRRVMLQLELPSAASAEVPLPPWANRGCTCQRAPVLTMMRLLRLICRAPCRRPDAGRRRGGKTSPFCKWAGYLPTAEELIGFSELFASIGPARQPPHQRSTTSPSGAREAPPQNDELSSDPSTHS